MDDSDLRGIAAYRRLSETIATAGQPSESELAAVAAAGFEVVINLGLAGEYYSLADEKGVVESMGLEYVHIPVAWEKPRFEDLKKFFAAVCRAAGRRLLIHCAANARVSVFMALYRILELSCTREDALKDVRSIWEPNDVWQRFFEAMLLRRPARGQQEAHEPPPPQG
jgi:uncharacterized protein (TIGR01244 family)